MTTREHDPASASLSEDEFFEFVPDSEEDNLPFDLRPVDPVLERKMTPDVRIRRARLARLVAAVVGCGVLLLLAAMAHLHLTLGPGAAAAVDPAAEMHATVLPAAGYRR